MSELETQLNNVVLMDGWREGAASKERIQSVLSRLEGRMATLALVESDTDEELDTYLNAA